MMKSPLKNKKNSFLAQVVEPLPSKHGALSFISRTPPPKMKKITHKKIPETQGSERVQADHQHARKVEHSNSTGTKTLVLRTLLPHPVYLSLHLAAHL